MSNQDEHPPAESTHISTMFDALSDSRRRRLLRYLLGRDRPAAVADIAKQLTANEHDIPSDAVPTDETEQVYISLYHNHLPRLDEEGIIDYDRDRNAVALTDRARYLTAWIEAAPDD